MDKELKDQVKQLVDDMFSEKEEASIRERTEQELEKAATTISDLTTALEGKNSEFEEMEEKIEASDNRIAELESELEAAREELQTANEKAAETDTGQNKNNRWLVLGLGVFAGVFSFLILIISFIEMP